MRLDGNRMLCLAAGLLLVAAPLHAEDEEVLIGIEELDVVQIKQISAEGADILESIAAGRASLARRDRIGARRHVMHARHRLGVLAKLSPSVRLQGNIDDALHEAATGGNPDLMPIYEELDAAKRVTEFVDVRTHVDRAKAASKPEEVEAALVDASAAIVYTEIDLPIHETYARLARAATNIHSLNFGTADAALAEAQQHVQVVVAAAAVHVEAEEVMVEE